MAQCIVNNAGVLEFTIDPVSSCPGFIVLEPDEYVEMQFLTQAFDMPEVAQMQELFVWAFGIVVIPYLTAWAYQTVIAWFEDDISITINED